MSFTDWLAFQNPEVVAIALGVLVFVIVFSMMKRFMDRGPALITGVAMGAMAAYYLYRDSYIIGKNMLAIAVILAVLVILFVISRAFSRFGKHQFR